MKAVDFAYTRASSLAEVVDCFDPIEHAANIKIIAGGQTLGPMLNLRLVRPASLIDISRVPELQRAEETRDRLILGACVTHAAIEDGRVPDATNGFLARVAHGIAYRAVRNRGTIGGSLAHADPAADWLSALTALEAELQLVGAGNVERIVPVAGFATGAMTTVLAEDEFIETVRIPRLSAGARTGYAKLCRKTGEFADAIGVVVIDTERGVRRAVAGAVGGAPIVLAAVPATPDAGSFAAQLAAQGYNGDAYEMQVHGAALARAFAEATAP